MTAYQGYSSDKEDSSEENIACRSPPNSKLGLAIYFSIEMHKCIHAARKSNWTIFFCRFRQHQQWSQQVMFIIHQAIVNLGASGCKSGWLLTNQGCCKHAFSILTKQGNFFVSSTLCFRALNNWGII